MATKAFLPLLSKGGQSDLISKGDIIELWNGEKMIFMEMKRTKWTGKSTTSGNMYNIPIYKDRMGTTPFAKAVVGKSEEVLSKSSKPETLRKGDLFSLENAKQAFMFKALIGNKVHAIDIATGNSWKIGAECTFNKIDIETIKNKL
mgnify:CR=1 FL=1